MAEMVHISEAARRLGIRNPHYLRLLEWQRRIPPARRDPFGSRIYTGLDLALLKSIGVGSRPRRLKSAEEVQEVGS